MEVGKYDLGELLKRVHDAATGLDVPIELVIYRHRRQWQNEVIMAGERVSTIEGSGEYGGSHR